MSSRIRSAFSLCAATALAAGAAAVLPASAAAADDAAAGGSRTEPTAANVRTFLDKRVPELLEKHNVPGAAVSVVAGGQQVYASGYGEADIDDGALIEADTTSFPMASVSKSFTAAAVLQLVEQGKLDLETDVNEYLPADTRIPDTYSGAPVTMHHLLTHTAGFEDSVVGMASDSAEGMLPLGEYATEYMPDRIYPPGRFIAYSNYGTTLAGYVVQEVSGTPFSEYLSQNVFSPLSMEHSAFVTPDEAASRFETPTLYTATLEHANTLYVNQSPAGAGYATVADMSRFMLALLNGGQYRGQRILSPESAEMMLSTQETRHKELAGAGYGSWDKSGDWPHAIGHGGDLDGAHTEWAVVPEADLGVYVAVNGDGTASNPLKDTRALITEAVLQEFTASAADSAAESPASAGGNASLEPYAGTYSTTRISRSDSSELMSATGLTSVWVTDGGRLRTSNQILGEQVWTPAGDGLFRTEDGAELAFVEENGEVVGLAYGAIPTQNYERIAWHENVFLHLFVAGAALVVMCTVLAWPVAAIVRKLRGRSAPHKHTGGSRAARGLIATASAICVAFAGFAVSLLGDEGLLTTLVFNASPLLTVPLTVAAGVAACASVAAVLAWVFRWWSIAGRIHYTLTVLAAFAFLDFGAEYGLMLLPQ